MADARRTLVVLVCMLLPAPIAPVARVHADLTREESVTKAFTFLDDAMDQYHATYWVYQDVGSAGNHFHARGAIIDPSRPGDVAAVHMDEDWRDSCHAGASCIRCSFDPGGTGAPWAGFYFMNGVLLADDTQPQPNWGEHPDAGVDLTGATTLTFWARGAVGGERIDFFVGGVGWNPETGMPVAPYPDSTQRTPTLGHDFVLTTEWQEYQIALSGRDLSYVLGGFAWVAASEDNPTGATFYLDDISFDKPRPDEPRFVVSYRTIPSSDDFDLVMRNVAFVYDNALLLLAELARGTADASRRAALIADALVCAQTHDRYYSDGRLRSGYQGGDLVLPPGWAPNGRAGTVSMPGWWDEEHAYWYEDEMQVSTDTGNMAWAILALAAYSRHLLDTAGPVAAQPYLEAATQLGEWIVEPEHCYDTRGAGGYTGGFRGWEPDPARLWWKSTEHNLDCYAAFRLLHALTGEEVWDDRAAHALAFVESMWDPGAGHFWTGTLDDGVTPNETAVPVDVQAWAVLALGSSEYGPALQWVSDACRVETEVGGTSFSGFDFSLIPGVPGDGIWWEGTAQMAVAFLAAGRPSDSAAELQHLQTAQEFAPGGDGLGLVAATPGPLTTGFDWLYFARLHAGATAWFLLALNGSNPFSGQAASEVVASAGPPKTIPPGGSAMLEGGASGGLPPYVYSWSPSGGLSDATSAQPTATPTETTTYTLTVTDALAQMDTDAVTVTVASGVVADAGPDKVIAVGEDAVLEGAGSGGTPPYTYGWLPLTGLSDAQAPQPTASPRATTTYALTVADSLGQSGTDTVTVTVLADLVAEAGPDLAIAPAGSAFLGGTARGGVPPYTYSWSPSNGLDNSSAAQPEASPTETTMYTLAVSDSLGQTAADTATITVVAFSDVPAGFWAHDEVLACSVAGIVRGYPGGQYRPDLEVTRAQMAVYITRGIAGGDAFLPSGPAAPSFADVPVDHWAFRYVECATDRDVVQGYPDGTYHPDEVVNRAQMAVYVARAVAGGEMNVPDDTGSPPHFSDVLTTHWAYRYVEYCVAQGIVQGYWDGSYRPDVPVTREQMAVYVFRAMLGSAHYAVCVDEHDTPPPTDPEHPNYYNATGGDRGLLHAEEVSYGWDGDSSYAATVAASSGLWTWGGMWYSLTHIDRDNRPTDFSAIFGPLVRSEHQGSITGGELVVRDLASPTGNTLLELRVELKDEQGAVVWSKAWTDLTSQPCPRTFAWFIPEDSRGHIETVLWILDRAQPGDTISVDSVRLRARVPGPARMPTSEQAFLWSYSWLMGNYNAAEGMVDDRSNFGTTEFENVSAAAKAAKVACYAYLKGYTSYDDAASVVTAVADTLIHDVPRGPVVGDAVVNTLWPHFTRLGGREAIPPHDGFDGTEWASGDSAFAALDLVAALQMLLDAPEGAGDPLGLAARISDAEAFLSGIDWADLLTEDGGISHGYQYNGDPLPGAWRGFGMETIGVNWAYAAATGQVATMEEPPSDNGSGFIDNANYPMVLGVTDQWGNDWVAYRQTMADTQIGWYTPERSPFLADAWLFGLSAAEVPDARSSPAELYKAYGVGGKRAGTEDGDGEVLVLHYPGMIADLRPAVASRLWETLRDGRADFLRGRTVISPLNNVESMQVGRANGSCVANPLKGSWNLALQAEGWAMADPAVKAALAAVIPRNPFLNAGYNLIAGD